MKLIYIPFILLSLLFIVGSLLLSNWVQNVHNEQMETERINLATDVLNRFEGVVNEHIITLSLVTVSLNQYETLNEFSFGTVGQYYYNQWDVFLQAVSFSVYLKNESLIPFITNLNRITGRIGRMPQDRAPNGTLIPLSPANEYLIVSYVQPYVGNEQSYLLNVFSNEVILEVVNLSRTTRQVQISSPFRLVQEQGDQQGVILYGIVYINESFYGAIQVVYRLDDFLSQFVLELDNSKVALRLEDTTLEVPIMLASVNKGGDFASQRCFPVTARTWCLTVYTLPNFGTSSPTPTVVLIVSLILSVILPLLTAIIYFTTTNRKLIREREKLRLEFVNYLFHEIRVPFNTVNIAIQSLRSNLNESPTITNMVNMACAASQQAIEVLNTVLDLEKFQQGYFVLSKSWIPVSELVGTSQWMYNLQAQQKHIDITTQYDPSVQCIEVYADKFRLQQCISNYLSNAIKFTDYNGQVSITSSMINSNLRITVEDNGCGITETNMKLLFQPYKQININPGGTGLGLTIVNTIITTHGGTTGVESKIGRGSKFWFEIPVESRKTRSYNQEAQTNEYELSENFKSQNSEIRILLVDDDFLSRVVMVEVLQQYGCICDTAENGQIGVEMALKNDYSFIIMDKTMPVMNGIEATKAIRAAGKTTPIIALTGNAMEQERLQFQTAGSNFWLTKPVNLSDLRTILGLN